MRNEPHRPRCGIDNCAVAGALDDPTVMHGDDRIDQVAWERPSRARIPRRLRQAANSRRHRTPRLRPVFESHSRRYAAATVSAVSGHPGKASGGHRKDARGMAIIGLSMAAGGSRRWAETARQNAGSALNTADCGATAAAQGVGRMCPAVARRVRSEACVRVRLLRPARRRTAPGLACPSEPSHFGAPSGALRTMGANWSGKMLGNCGRLPCDEPLARFSDAPSRCSRTPVGGENAATGGGGGHCSGSPALRRPSTTRSKSSGFLYGNTLRRCSTE